MEDKEDIKVEEVHPESGSDDAVRKEVISWVKTIVFALLLGIFVNTCVIVNAEIPSASMTNTIKIGDKVIALRLAYLFDEPQKGDIIVFRYPDDETRLFVKRLIGMPGDTVEAKDGNLYINGEIVQEDYIKEQMDSDFPAFKVPEGSYFMMGDNRNDSWDSRYWDHHFLTRDGIVGKVMFQYYPAIRSVK